MATAFFWKQWRSILLRNVGFYQTERRHITPGYCKTKHSSWSPPLESHLAVILADTNMRSALNASVCVSVCVCVCGCVSECEVRHASLPYLRVVYFLKTQSNNLHFIFQKIRHTSNKDFLRTVTVYWIFNVT